MNGQGAWCTFRLGGRLYGVAVDRVQEVLRSAAVTPVPLAPPAVRGLINLRGEIVTVVDLRRPLGMEEPGDLASASFVVVRDGQTIMTLAVDAIEDVLRTHEDDFEPCPDTLQAGAREMIEGCCKLPNDLLLLLNLERALAVATQ